MSSVLFLAKALRDGLPPKICESVVNTDISLNIGNDAHCTEVFVCTEFFGRPKADNEEMCGVLFVPRETLCEEFADSLFPPFKDSLLEFQKTELFVQLSEVEKSNNGDIIKLSEAQEDGGPGSGNFGHGGRPGKLGGSAPEGASSQSNETSGAISGARNPDGKAAKKHAKKYYMAVSKMKDDVSKVAKSSGFTEDEILSVKNYIFNDSHDLGDGRKGKFDPDFMMAESWRRLIFGNPETHDITLIKHELYEMSLVRQGLTQDEAHIISSTKFNYSKEAEDFYGKIKKYKKE